MVVVDGATAGGTRTSADGVGRQLTVVVIARKECHGGHPLARCFSFPSQSGTSSFVFSPSEGVDALAGIGAVVIFEQTAGHVGFQVGMNQRSAQPAVGTEFVIAPQSERVFFATTVLLPVVVITL